MSIYVFDFDGVLACPYTDPELLFPGAERLLRDLNQDGHMILIASFNPRAYTVLRGLYEEGVIADIRAGNNTLRWWRVDDGTYSDAKYRRTVLSKAAMIGDMIDKTDTRVTHFFDDDPDNIRDVRKEMLHVECYHVPNWGKGLVPHYDEWFGDIKR